MFAAERELERGGYAATYPWFALKVRAGNEQLAAGALRAKNYECLLPTYPERRRYSDRLKQVQSALFPGYVFCRFDPLRRLPILTTPAVQYVVALGKVPQPVDEMEIASIQQIAKSGVLAMPWPYLKAGQRVRIEEGPLAGVEGLLCREKGKDRLVVSVHLLQRSVSVEIDRYRIRPT
jgi:transcriptional antiterminator NusG